ncbi:hypothetical protein H6G56_16945 [Anabaena variabilis FACHB-164]|uniref:Uncharacterized protein n=2 Tax=Anabaena variabilis TaxID=264691 RepID=A0A3S1CR07_ANAVA|nr:hypothetical protein [Trichormus variabilis FACHB-164]RUS96853.1 hypothetical protein DSM107003_22590 [Trichormus variabilis SAG 1403-4b]
MPPVTDKSLIPLQSWKKHSDPPFLWVSVFISSISLHLLVFWLLGSSDEFRPWIPHSSQANIPVDFIDISPQEESTAKPKFIAKAVTPKFSSSTQNSVTASLPKTTPETTPTTPENQDDGAISSDFNPPQESQTENSQVNNQPVPKPVDSIPEPTETPAPTETPTSTETPAPTETPTSTETIPLDNLPWNRRQEVKLGQGTLLPKDIPSDSPTSTEETSPTPTEETSPTPTEETSPTPTEETSPTPTEETSPTSTEETSPTPTGGGILANVSPLLKDEVNQLIQERRLIKDALPDVLAAYQGSSSKQLEVSFFPSDSEIKPANILVSLVIDKNGKFQQAVVLEIEPTTLSSERSIYEQALNDIFMQESFIAAHNEDGSKPDLSNLYMRIQIQPINSP